MQNVSGLIRDKWPHAPLLDQVQNEAKLVFHCQPTCTNEYASAFSHYIGNTPFVFSAQECALFE